MFTEDELQPTVQVLDEEIQSPTRIQSQYLSENSHNSNINHTASIIKPKLSTGLTTATAHICLSESPIANIDKSESIVISAKQNNIDKQKDQQSLDVSVPLFDKSFSSGKDDIFSCRTIESSDSDMSQSSNGSVDSQQEDDLPQITYRKQIHLRPSEFLNTPLTAAKGEKLETLVANDDIPTALICSQSHYKGSSSTSKTEQTKYTSTSDSKHLASHQVKNNIVFPCVKEQVQNQKDCIDVPFEGIVTTDHVSSSTSRWSPIVSKSVANSWTPPRASGNQQTVTIESTHKIIYNNPVPENIMGQSHFGNSKEYRGARPKYSAPTQNITVNLPLDPPQFQFMDTSSALSTPKAECTALNR